MGMFSYVYYSNLIRVHTVTVGSVLQTIVNGLSTEDQWSLVEVLTRLLEGRSTLKDLKL
jgi:phosphatidate cytidylyltransferase